MSVRPTPLLCVVTSSLFVPQTLDQFNALCEPLTAKLEAPLTLALSRAGIAVSQLAAIEIVGGGMRPRCIKQRIATVLGLPGADDHAAGYGLRYSA
jgi:molecular chaperone DnaK (HSP70)